MTTLQLKDSDNDTLKELLKECKDILYLINLFSLEKEKIKKEKIKNPALHEL